MKLFGKGGKFNIIDVIDALVYSQSDLSNKQNEKLIDLNRKALNQFDLIIRTHSTMSLFHSLKLRKQWLTEKVWKETKRAYALICY